MLCKALLASGNPSRTSTFYPCPWPREWAFISRWLFMFISQKKVSCGNVFYCVEEPRMFQSMNAAVSSARLYPLYPCQSWSFLVLHALLLFVIPLFFASVLSLHLSAGSGLHSYCKHIYCQHCCCKAAEDSNRCLSTAGQISSALKDLCCRRGLVSPGIVCLLIPSPRYLWKIGMNNWKRFLVDETKLSANGVRLMSRGLN